MISVGSRRAQRTRCRLRGLRLGDGDPFPATLDIDLLILIKDQTAVARAGGYDVEGLRLNFDSGKTQIRHIRKLIKIPSGWITLDLILGNRNLRQRMEDEKRK